MRKQKFNVGDHVIIKDHPKNWKGVIENVPHNKGWGGFYNTEESGYIIRPTDGKTFSHGRFRDTGQTWVCSSQVVLYKRKEKPCDLPEDLFEL